MVAPDERTFGYLEVSLARKPLESPQLKKRRSPNVLRGRRRVVFAVQTRVTAKIAWARIRPNVSHRARLRSHGNSSVKLGEQAFDHLEAEARAAGRYRNALGNQFPAVGFMINATSAKS
jgi:hypothetical protein